MLVNLTFKSQPHKIVKPTQTIRRHFADELSECDHFLGLVLKEFKRIESKAEKTFDEVIPATIYYFRIG